MLRILLRHEREEESFLFATLWMSWPTTTMTSSIDKLHSFHVIIDENSRKSKQPV
jgi:hypothetical protein